MFKPCPNCGFLVALIAGREASQRCPRCGSAMLADAEPGEAEAPRRRRRDADTDALEGPVHPAAPAATAATADLDAARAPTSARGSNAAVGDQPAPEAPPSNRSDAAAGAIADPAADSARTTHVPAAAPATAAADGPSFVRRRAAARPRGRRWPWWAAVATLALLLAVQLLLAQRVELARDAAWRPLVLRACAVLGCDVAPWHEPHAFAMLARGVRPLRAGVLRVTATVRNDARWPQRAPVVMLSLSDVDGRVVAARAVPPAAYGRAPAALLAPGDSLDIAFDVREPAGHVESFDFQLQ